jgi:hypothetical protein
MVQSNGKFIISGTRVRVKSPGSVPATSTWDDDHQRTSTPVKKRLQQAFFKGDKKVRGEVIYISSESIRERLRSKGQVKVEIRDPAGSCIVITAESALLAPA